MLFVTINAVTAVVKQNKTERTNIRVPLSVPLFSSVLMASKTIAILSDISKSPVIYDAVTTKNVVILSIAVKENVSG